MNQGILIALIAGLVIFFFLFFVIKSSTTEGKERIPDYRSLFILGIVWIPIGISIGNPGLWGMGIVFAMAGAANKDKWGKETKWADLPPQTRKIKIIFIVTLTIFLLLGLGYFIFSKQS